MTTITEASSDMKLLLRSLKPNIFRLIIVQHNHRQIIDQVVEQIQQTYPDRFLNRLQLAHKGYRELTEAIYKQYTGILIIEDFHKILDKPEVYAGFNQRRDKIAQYPLALICFVPIGDKVLQECMKKLPDFWSFRNLLVKLDQEQAPEYSILQESEKEISTIGGDTIYEKEKELNRLIARVDELQPNPENISLINSYYPQILQLLEEIGNYQRGLEYAERFVNLAEENHYSQTIPSVYSDALNWQAKFFQYLGQYEQARDLLEKALDSAITNYGENHPEVAIRQSNLALVYKDLGQYPQARDLLEKALDSAITNYGEKHPTVATRKSNLALVYQDLGEYEQARELFEDTMTFAIANYEENHPNIARSKSNLASVYQALGQYEQASELLEDAIASDIDNFGENHPNVARSKSNLASVYQALGRYEQARELLEEAMASDIDNYGETHPSVAIRQSNLAMVYKDLGQYEQARELLEKALASDINRYGDKHLYVAIRLSNLAFVYKDLGEDEKAKELMGQAYVIYSHTQGEDHPNTQMVKSFLEQIDRK